MNISNSYSLNSSLEIGRITYPNGGKGVFLGNKKYKIVKVQQGLFEKYINSFINFVLGIMNRPRRWAELHVTIDQQEHLLYVKVNNLTQALCLNEDENKEMHELLKANASLDIFVYQKIQQEINHLIFIEEAYPAERRTLQDQLTGAREALRKNPKDRVAKESVERIQLALNHLEEKRQKLEALYGTAATHLFLAIPGFKHHAQQLFAVFKGMEPLPEKMNRFVQEYNKIASIYIHAPYPSAIDIIPFFKACLFYLHRKNPELSDNIIQQIRASFDFESDNINDAKWFVYLPMLQMCVD